MISEYAIGGAVAAMHYVEAVATEDVDVFALMEPKPGQLLITLDAIYPALEASWKTSMSASATGPCRSSAPRLD